MNRLTKLLLVALILLVGIGFNSHGRSVLHPLYLSVMSARTVKDAMNTYAADAESRLVPRFEAAGLSYPPHAVTLIGLKQERQLELWAKNEDTWRFIHSYPIKAASGNPGPKLQEGDGQVPEGIYKVVGLNPNSSYHLSLKLNYPNSFDLHYAGLEHRTEPGSDIFIHGRAVSIGCLAMGDPAIEELFVLVERVGRNKVEVLIAPHDARARSLFPVPSGLPHWTPVLYQKIEETFARYDKSEGNSP